MEVVRRNIGWVYLGLAITSLIISFFGLEGGGVSVLWWVDIVMVAGGFIYVVIAQKMFSYVLKRIGETAFVLFVIASATFFLLRILPGGPFDSEKALPPEVKANIEAKYGLGDPLPVQYLNFLTKTVQGDLGESYKYIGRSVTDIISESMPASFQLGIYALIISYLIGIPLGVLAAWKHNTWMDTLAMSLAMSGVSLPSFLTAPILIIVFCFWLDWLPPALWDGPEYYIIPVIVLGIRPAAVIARLTRSSVLEVIKSDFVRTAKAKGLGIFSILFKHVLKNSLIPVLTYSGPLIAGILSGTFVIEVIFAVPGIGKHFVQSVTNRDYPLILGLTLLYGAMLVIANLIVDILYAIFDPRIRLS